jgi:hypothetical protein
MLWNLILALVKASVLFFFLRLGSQWASVRIWIHMLSALNLMLFVVIAFGCVFQCTPVRKSWDPTIPENEGRCIDLMAWNMFIAASTVFTDILVLAIPVYIVWSMTMRRRLKAFLLIVLMLGAM